jgi:4-hydroxy-4-methyl-2-oxoglutarate aldolase
MVSNVPNPYSIPLKEMADRYSRLYIAAINDIFQERGLHHQWLGPEISCKTMDLQDKIIAGAAFTVQWIFDPLPDEREKPAAKMIESYPEDGIIVVDAGADQISGFWGELVTTVCLNNGVRGAVINGGAKPWAFRFFANIQAPWMVFIVLACVDGKSLYGSMKSLFALVT